MRILKAIKMKQGTLQFLGLIQMDARGSYNVVK